MASCLCLPISETRADLFGGDVAVLTQILVQTIQQLAQLRQILGAGKDTLGLMRDINRGINDSLSLMRTIGPGTDPGIYRDWNSVDSALRHLQAIYGGSILSKDSRAQQDADQSVAEAVAKGNALYKYTGDIDQVGERVKSASHSVSPGGAQKLTAETLGVILNVLNESLRTQATGLKLQAQVLALSNKREKEGTKFSLETSDALVSAMKNHTARFEIPRF
jgi:hypothetical protein